MKKLLSLMLIALIIMGSFVSIGFGEGKKVSKVVFRGMSSTQTYTALGKIRLYNGDTLIEAGKIITNTQNYGETDNFKVSTSTSLLNNDYYFAVNVIRQDLPETAELKTYWLVSKTDRKDLEISIDLKNPQDVSRIDFIPQPHTNESDRGITENFFIDVYYEDGDMLTHEITPKQENKSVQSLILHEVITTPSFNVISNTTELNAGDTVEVNLTLNDAKDIYAEDFTFKYDPNAFEIVNEKITDEVSNKLFHTDKIDGEIRYVIGSNGKAYGINEDKAIVTITLKAKNFDGKTDVGFSSGLIADSKGNEITTINNGLSFSIIGPPKDVNNTGTFTLGDLSIACYLLDSDSSTWGNFTPDVDNSGAVDTLDLSKIVEEILKN